MKEDNKNKEIILNTDLLVILFVGLMHPGRKKDHVESSLLRTEPKNVHMPRPTIKNHMQCTSNLSIATIKGNSEKGRIRQEVLK